MTYKELTPQEVAKMLSENPDGFEGYVRNDSREHWKRSLIDGVQYGEIYNFFAPDGNIYMYCAIAIPDTYEPYPEDEMPDLKRLDGVLCKYSNIEHTVLMVDKNNLSFNHIYLHGTGWINNENLFKNFTHLDGSPIGRKVGE